MNDPTTFAATEPDDRDGIPDTTARSEESDGSGHPAPDPAPAPAPAPAAGSAPPQTLLETAATCRPVEEVTALVSLLKETGRLPHHGHDALRAAAAARPVHDVQRVPALSGEHPREEAGADITPRAAAVGRLSEDVAPKVSVLGTERTDARRPAEPPIPFEEPPEPTDNSRPAGDGRPADTGWPARPVPSRPTAAPAAAARPPGARALRHMLRRPVAAVLLLCGVLHLPSQATALPRSPGEYLPLAVAVLCLGLGALLVVRDTPAVWRSAAVAALGPVTLHVLGGVTLFDPLEGTVGGPYAWAGITAVLSAAVGSVLAGLALTYRPPDGGASDRA